jgi:hypothetical protein
MERKIFNLLNYTYFMDKMLKKYKHYKGKEYEIIAFALDSETLEEVVVYKGLYNSKEFGNNPIWVRPKKEFFEKVIVDGKEIERFKRIDID